MYNIHYPLFITQIHAVNFLNEVLQQKVQELENTLCQDRMMLQEQLSAHRRRHKLAIKKLEIERIRYEESANYEIGIIREQMAQLQNHAMARIEVRVVNRAITTNQLISTTNTTYSKI